jgi:hypothetical protein
VTLTQGVNVTLTCVDIDEVEDHAKRLKLKAVVR